MKATMQHIALNNICVKEKDKEVKERDKMGDQLLIRSHAFFFYSCAIKHILNQ